MGLKLPVWLVLERYREYETEHVLIQKDTAADMLKKELAKQLDNVVGKDGQVLHTSYETRVTDDHIFVRVIGECLEEIGREVRADSTE